MTRHETPGYYCVTDTPDEQPSAEDCIEGRLFVDGDRLACGAGEMGGMGYVDTLDNYSESTVRRLFGNRFDPQEFDLSSALQRDPTVTVPLSEVASAELRQWDGSRLRGAEHTFAVCVRAPLALDSPLLIQFGRGLRNRGTGRTRHAVLARWLDALNAGGATEATVDATETEDGSSAESDEPTATPENDGFAGTTDADEATATDPGEATATDASEATATDADESTAESQPEAPAPDAQLSGALADVAQSASAADATQPDEATDATQSDATADGAAADPMESSADTGSASSTTPAQDSADSEPNTSTTPGPDTADTSDNAVEGSDEGASSDGADAAHDETEAGSQDDASSTPGAAAPDPEPTWLDDEPDTPALIVKNRSNIRLRPRIRCRRGGEVLFLDDLDLAPEDTHRWTDFPEEGVIHLDVLFDDGSRKAEQLDERHLESPPVGVDLYASGVEVHSND